MQRVNRLGYFNTKGFFGAKTKEWPTMGKQVLLPAHPNLLYPEVILNQKLPPVRVSSDSRPAKRRYNGCYCSVLTVTTEQLVHSKSKTYLGDVYLCEF